MNNLKFGIALLGFLLSLVIINHIWVQSTTDEKLFLSGTVPQSLDGFYRGSTHLPKFNWLGKSFNSAKATGFNNLQEDGKVVQRYPFKTYQAKGLQDKKLAVLRIDYDLAENPWWVKKVTDEIVEVGPGRLLGKVNYQILPGFALAIGYFALEKSDSEAF